jgi:hypothetical protein
MSKRWSGFALVPSLATLTAFTQTASAVPITPAAAGPGNVTDVTFSIPGSAGAILGFRGSPGSARDRSADDARPPEQPSARHPRNLREAAARGRPSGPLWAAGPSRTPFSAAPCRSSQATRRNPALFHALLGLRT